MAVRRSTPEVDGDAQATVVRFGGRPKFVSIEDGETTVIDAIEEAGFTVKANDEVSVNGEGCDEDDLDTMALESGDRVVITPKFEGGNK